MLMPTASAAVESSLPVLGQATTVLTPTTVSTLPTLTTTIQPMTSKDTTFTKLFVGGLPYHTTDKSLREHFEVFGEIEEAVVITDRSTGKSRGYGFVIMSTKDCAERACKEPNPIIDGRKANVNLAILGAKPRGNVTAASLPLAALRPGFPAILQSQYGDLLGHGAGGQLGLGAAAAAGLAGAAAAPAALVGGTPSSAAAVPVSLAAATGGGGGPGKARSSMNLGLMTGRQAVPAAAAANSPYLQQLYTAGAPYMHPNLLNLGQLAGADPYQGNPISNPLLDFYNQYAASLGFPGAAVTQAMVPAVQSSSLDSNNAAAMAAGGYFGYTYAPISAQQLAAAAAAGLPYAAAAAATAASPVGQPAAVPSQPPPQQSEARIQ